MSQFRVVEKTLVVPRGMRLTKRGDAKMSSQFLAHMKILEKMNMYLRQFGLSPQSRIQAPESEEKEDEFSAWKKRAKK